MSITAMEQDTVTTSSDKVDVVHHDGLEKQLTVEPLPEALRLEAGVLMNIDTNAGTSLRLAANGHTVLIPQPTDDPDDPLNWSAAKKHTVLLTIAWGALVADFTSAAGSAPIFLQAGEWEKSVSQINQTNSINVLMMALGSLVWVPMTSYIGRAPTLFWSSIMACAFSIGAVLSPNYTCFYAMRALTGINATSAQTISIAFIRDMFFLHERARKIGLWAALYISSPYLGPLLGNFVLGGNGTWQDVYWLSVGVCGIDLVLIAVFLDETWYNRTVHRAAQPPRGRGVLARMARLTGTWQLRHRRPYFTSVSTAYRKLFITLTKPTIFLVLLAYLMFFCWAIGINITTAVLFATPTVDGGYGFSYNTVGYIYFSPIVGIVIGEVFGHYFNDFLARRYIRTHKGVYESEARLPAIYVSAVFMVAGLVLLGQALQRHLHVAAVILGWGMSSLGVMIASVAVSAYVVDSYPNAAAEVSGWTNFARAIGGFSVGYYQQPWGARVGYGASFGTQAGIVGVGVIFVAVAHRYGHALRLKAGPIE